MSEERRIEIREVNHVGTFAAERLAPVTSPSLPLVMVTAGKQPEHREN
jgi:hypothetical protein